VPLLVLFDAVNPAIGGLRSWRTILAMANYHARVLGSLPIRDTFEYVQGRLATLGGELGATLRRAARAGVAVAPPGAPARAYVEAIGFDRYRPKAYQGRTVLFCGEWARPHVDARFGWGDLVGDNLDVVRLSCGHLEMLQEPLVAAVAEQLDTRLRSL
jgi:hypothetical protein